MQETMKMIQIISTTKQMVLFEITVHTEFVKMIQAEFKSNFITTFEKRKELCSQGRFSRAICP